MKFKSIIFAGLAACLSIGPLQAQDINFFRIGTGSSGGTYFPIGGLIANAISNPPGARDCDKGGSCGVPGLVAIAVSTNASVANVNAIQEGTLDAGLSGSDIVYWSYNGLDKFEGDPKNKLRVIAKLYPEDTHLVLADGVEINSIADLKGKRVGIAQAGSGTQVAVLKILEHFGVTRDDIEAAELNNTQSAQRIADGQLDAYFYVMGSPSSALVQLASTKGFNLYKFSEDEMAQISELIPFYSKSNIASGTYAGLDYDTPTVAATAILVTSADKPDDLIYDITKALWNENSRKLFDNGHAKGRSMQLENALDGIVTPIHPGAEKFYKEVGVLK